MADLYQAIKGIMDTSIKNYGLCELAYGTVLSVSSLKVKVSDRITLEGEQLLMTQTVTEKTINVKHRHIDTEPNCLTEPIVVRDGLKAGDQVLMLKVQRGQKYIILSKVVKA